MAQKVSHYQIIKISYKIILKPARLDSVVKLKYHSNTKILSVGIKYYMRDLYLDVNNYALPQTSDMRHVTAGTLVPSSVNGDIEIQWEWSNSDPSQNPNPSTDYDKTLHK